MESTMVRYKDIANAHLQADMDAGQEWGCECEACHNIRSLVGMNKMLDVWPLVNELRETEDRLDHLPDGPEKQGVVELYHNLADHLAEEVAK